MRINVNRASIYTLLALTTRSFHKVVQAKRRNHLIVRIFIVAGEANVEGFASTSHLHQLVTGQSDSSDYYEPPYQHLWNATNSSWIVRDDVFVAYDHYRTQELIHGPLAVGGKYGAESNTFGPELQMGHVLGNLYNEPVVIIKAGWKGRSLSKDFASPSMSEPGFQWLRMIKSIHKIGNSLHEILGNPAYKYCKPVIGGFVWWQGYTDLVNKQMNENYADNLVKFIGDLRTELKQPGLPVIVGELGGRGWRTKDEMELEFRQMQEKVVEENYFNRTVVFVPTAIHVKTTPAIKNFTYYYGNAPTMIDIGQAFAAALTSFDPDLKPNMDSNAGYDWVLRDSDLTAGEMESSDERLDISMVCFALAILFVIVSMVCFRGNMRRTWNTAFSRLRPEKDNLNISAMKEYSDENPEDGQESFTSDKGAVHVHR
jgi:hypothetical protein